MDESITLVNDWDYQPKLGDKIGHHVIREKEHSILLDFLTRRREGSLIVCGFRGIGKTSSIFGAINEAVEKRKKLIPILIKATSIHFENNEKKKTMLKQLIKSLHKNFQKNPVVSKSLKEKTEDLYNKSIASELYDEKSLDKQQSIETSSKTNFNLIPAAILIISGFLFFIPELSSYSWILSGISIGSGVFLGIEFSRKTMKKSSEIQSSHFRRDYDFATLQSDFEDLIEISKSDHKILFILDEFDKIDEPLEIVKDLKMLINQGNILFIFITTPEILSNLKTREQEGYTLFSQTLFLKRPLFKEMELYIDKIIHNFDEDIQNNGNYKHLKNYLCYLSHTNFFELYNLIRNMMIKDDQGNLCLNLDLENNQSQSSKINWMGISK